VHTCIGRNKPKTLSGCFIVISTRYHMQMLSALYAIARPSARPSICLSVTRVDQSKKVEVRIMQFLPYGSTIPLVVAR